MPPAPDSAPRRPVVLVPGRWTDEIGGRKREGVFVPRTLVDAIARAGGEPLLAWPDTTERAAALVELADAVVLQGGADLDLRPFGVPDVHPREEHAPPEQDAADLAVTRAALAAGIPILAVCRGMQVLNIVLGGTIFAHFDETSVKHADNPHEVDIVPGTLLEEIMGAGPLVGWSNHHQACDRLADDLLLSATTPDGVIEAFESRDANIVAVQWHPEMDAAQLPFQQALFDWVVKAAGSAETTPQG